MEVAVLFPLYRRAVREATRVAVATIFVPLILPLFMLFIFARVFASLVGVPGFSHGVEYSAYVAPAIVLMGAMLGSPTAGVSTAVELQTGFFERMRLSPAGCNPSLVARRLADCTRLAFFAVVLVLAARLDGVPIHNWALALAVTVVLSAWWGVSYGGLSLSACLRTSSAETSQALVPLFFPILFMSTAFVPMKLLPGWLQPIARYNPVTYLSDTIRASFAGHVVFSSLWRAVLGTVIVMVLTQTLVWRAKIRLEA
jgi:ABC-2 type transport system permease protein